MKLPRTSPVVGPGRLALRFDPMRNRKNHWSILSETPLYGTNLVGYRRAPGENFAGLYAYRFRTWRTAHKVLLRLQAQTPIQDGLA